METRTYRVFKFDELPEEAQQKAIDKFRERQHEDQWWDFIYQDAKDIGLQINGFDLDRGAYCKGEWLTSPLEAIKLIKKNHGKKCETYKTAMAYSKMLKGKNKENEQLEDDFRNSLLEDYRILLEKEYEWLMSDECIKETILANDYDFLENGNID